MAAETTSSAGTIERRSDAAKKDGADKALWKFWMDAINLAGTDEKEWREDAERVIKRYRGEEEFKNQRYRLLYSNTQTMAPALFNSQPIPDIRRRYGDRDEDARQVAQALERTISCQAEKCDFEDVMEEAVMHRLLPGRAVVRVRYVPSFVKETQPDPADPNKQTEVEVLANEAVEYEVVPWADFRHGPGKRWSQVPWCAFRIYPTREELEKLNPRIGTKVPLNAKMGDDKQAGAERNPPSLYKRAEVWQVWDKERRELVYVSPDWKEGPIAVVPDELKLEGFFPTPKPMLAVKSPDDLRPITEWSQYALLAEELEEITQRLRKLVKAARWRGVTAKELRAAFESLKNLGDGELASAEEAITFANEGGLDKAIWIMPIDKLVAAIQQLYQAREQTKQLLYEVMGLSDILRGSTKPNETATAQDIKAQWGSLRMQKGQSQVQRYCRDLYRIGVEIIATRFDPKSIMLASGVQLSEQQVAMMQRDTLREYRIEVETDSTIRADLSRQQENIGQFVTGFGALMTALGPPVQAGVMKADEAADLITGFARSYKLGRQAEEALERMGDRLKEESKSGQGGQQQNPEMMKAQAQQVMQQQELQFKQASMQMDMAMKEKELEIKERELALKEREAQMRLQELDMQHRYNLAEMNASEQAAQMGHARDLEKLEASRAVGVPGPEARQ
jgi:energy-coupling factor transporter ATP-binding protein EcfA2